MENNKLYYNLILELIRNHRKYSLISDYEEKVAEDVYARSSSILETIGNEKDTVSRYLQKVVSVSVAVILQEIKSVNNKKTNAEDNYSELNYRKKTSNIYDATEEVFQDLETNVTTDNESIVDSVLSDNIKADDVFIVQNESTTDIAPDYEYSEIKDNEESGLLAVNINELSPSEDTKEVVFEENRTDNDSDMLPLETENNEESGLLAVDINDLSPSEDTKEVVFEENSTDNDSDMLPLETEDNEESGLLAVDINDLSPSEDTKEIVFEENRTDNDSDMLPLETENNEESGLLAVDINELSPSEDTKEVVFEENSTDNDSDMLPLETENNEESGLLAVDINDLSPSEDTKEIVFEENRTDNDSDMLPLETEDNEESGLLAVDINDLSPSEDTKEIVFEENSVISDDFLADEDAFTASNSEDEEGESLINESEDISFLEKNDTGNELNETTDKMSFGTDLNAVQSELCRLNTAHPSLQIADVFDLKYKQNYSIKEISDKLSMSEYDIAETLCKIVSVVED